YSPTPLRTIARITAFKPGQSPPPVRTPIRMAPIYCAPGERLRPGDPVDDRTSDEKQRTGEDAAQEEERVDRPGNPEGVADHHCARAEHREEDHLHGGKST